MKNIIIMIYYLHPWLEKYPPIGGILKIFDHVKLLNQEGIKASTVYYNTENYQDYSNEVQDIDFNWAQIKSKSLPFSIVKDKLKPNDIVVIPEIDPYLIKFVNNAKKVCFVQNWHKIKNGLREGETYKSLGFDFIITCGDFLTSYIKGEKKSWDGGNHDGGNIKVFTINNAINHEIFYKSKFQGKNNRVIMLMRKGRTYIKQIIKKTLFQRMLGKFPYKFQVIKQSIPQDVLAEEFRKSDIYIHTGFPEGLPLPPLEAMACGCLVIGFAGGGGLENMIHGKTSLVSPDGNVEDIIKNLYILADNIELKERLRNNGYLVAMEHSVNNEKNKLLKVFNEILKKWTDI